MRSHGRIAAALAIALSAAMLVPGAAGAVTYQTGPITLPGTAMNQPGDPYPMPLRIKGVKGKIADLEVKLLGVTTSDPSAIDALLVGPGGQRVMLMSDACAGAAVSEHTFVFDDDATRPLPPGSCAGMDGVPAMPTDYDMGESLNPPAPLAPYGTFLSVYEGSSPNGVWNLWLRNDTQVHVAIVGILAAVAIPAFFGKDHCRGKLATIFGTDGPETINGTPGADVILARGGKDRVHGAGAGDLICGGRGRDRLSGGRGGDDVLLGGPGGDRLRGADGDDTLHGHKGADSLNGGSGEDLCVGGAGNDAHQQCEVGDFD